MVSFTRGKTIRRRYRCICDPATEAKCAQVSHHTVHTGAAQPNEVAAELSKAAAIDRPDPYMPKPAVASAVKQTTRFAHLKTCSGSQSRSLDASPNKPLFHLDGSRQLSCRRSFPPGWYGASADVAFSCTKSVQARVSAKGKFISTDPRHPGTWVLQTYTGMRSLLGNCR